MAGEIPSLMAALQHSLRELGLERRFKSEQIAVIWPKVVGQAIAKIAHPTQLRNRTLYIDVADNVWMQELKLRQRDLLEQLNDALGEPLVERLFLRLGHIPPAAAGEQAERPSIPDTNVPLAPHEEDALDREVASVADPELRQVLKRFRRRMLQRQGPAQGSGGQEGRAPSA
jgi:hypothetical protein